MEALTSINKMLIGNKIFVPNYQRAYSWDTDLEHIISNKQVNTFMSDLENYVESLSHSNKSPAYYFGHFIFEKKDNKYGVIDGQQRLTTIIIFLSVLFSELKTIRSLTEDEEILYENIIKRKSSYTFSTVEYDNQLFRDYVIDQIKTDKNGIETISAKRFVDAFDFFKQNLSNKEEKYLLSMLKAIVEASCTTHTVNNEVEAIQMFIFQNNRGKKPSNLEIIKAQFMFSIHLNGGEEKNALIEEIKNRFEKIYKSISLIENKINEDDILVYTLRVFFNSLWETNALDKINKELSKENPIPFIKAFTHSLSLSFEHLSLFFGKDEKENFNIHSLITLGRFGIAIPFIIKAYTFGLGKDKISQLCSSFETLVLRHRLIGTRADITSRINDVYQNFTQNSPSITPIIERINWIKNVSNDSWWWAHWNNEHLKEALQGKINHSVAKFLLWKYENYLESKGKSGYSLTRYDKIENPELEHIAPQTATKNEPVAAGYDKYDDEFLQQFIDSIGNYLLISKSHNSSVGNKPFSEKRKSYTHLSQQREIQEMTKENDIWNKEKINIRKEKIIKFILENL